MRMKRYLFVAAALIAVLSCTKKGGNGDEDLNKPVFTWEANPNFGPLEIEEEMHSQIDISAPLGVASFTVTFSTLPVELIGVVNSVISDVKNKATSSKPAVFDLVNDTKLAQRMADMHIISPAGAKLAGATSAKFDIGYLIKELCEGQLLENGAKFGLDVALVDQNANSLKKTATFNWTAPPDVVFDPDEFTVELTEEKDSYPVVVRITAPGKIEDVIVSFLPGEMGKDPDAGIVAFIKSYTKQEASFSLTEQPKVASVLGLPSTELKGKTSAELNLNTLLSNLALQATGGGTRTLLSVEVLDALGKVTADGIAIVVP